MACQSEIPHSVRPSFAINRKRFPQFYQPLDEWKAKIKVKERKYLHQRHSSCKISCQYIPELLQNDTVPQSIADERCEK